MNNDAGDVPPEEGGAFKEVEINPDGEMSVEILKIVIEALNQQGYPDLDENSIRSDPTHRGALVAMLRDCRPLPVILSMIEDIESGSW